MTSQAGLHWWNKNRDWGPDLILQKTNLCGYKVSTETLYESRRQPLDLLQTIGVGDKVGRADLHSGAEHTCYKGGGGANADTDSSVNDRLIIYKTRFDLETFASSTC